MSALSEIYAEFRAGKIAYLMLQALPDTQVRVKLWELLQNYNLESFLLRRLRIR